jgi:predicted Zn-dependent protease
MNPKLLAALSASLLAIGCATTGLTGEGGSRGIAPGVAQQAAQQHPEVVQEFGGPVDAQLGGYVTQVGRRVAAQTGIQGGGQGAYTITTLNSPVLNAFAVPGGYVYVTRQLLAIMNDEAELASVLGHEMGHIAADHGAERQNRSIWTQLGSVLATVVTGSQQIGQLAGQVGQGLLLSYSRSQEYEADDLGVRYITNAGYDPMASASLLGQLGAATSLEDRLEGRDQRSIPSWARTHPLSEDRVRRATAQASKLQAPASVDRGRDRFLAAIDGMLYGDDPKHGMIEGRQFLHPVFGLRFTAPEGYGMQNGARAVSISGTNGQALFSTGRFDGNLDIYIGQVFRELTGGQTQITFPEPRSTTVNGIPAAYTTARVQAQQGQVDVSVFAYRWDSDTAYHFVTLTSAGSGLGPFSNMVGSLQRMSSSEAAAIRPRVVDIITVRAGDTVQSLAGWMAYNDYRLERFLMLNGLNANSQLAAGQKVKIIVYG